MERQLYKLLRKCGPEAMLNASLVEYIKLQYPKALLIHVPNEGKRSYAERALAQALGMLSGVPDLLIFDPKGEYNGLAIELKIKPNKTTKNQDIVLIKLKQRGWLSVVVYDLDEGIEIINQYFKNDK